MSRKMNQEKPLYSGILLFPPQGKIVIKKSWQQKYCLLFNSSKFGIERLEIYDHVDDYSKNSPSRIYTLENCIKIAQKDANMFSIITKQWNHTFGTLCTKELNDWLSALQSVAFKDDSSVVTSIVEDNDLYCSSGEGVFAVKLNPTDASERCGLEPKNYTLVITSMALQLQDSVSSDVLFTWPYQYIRRYGYKDGNFTFEAGRKCNSGEGSFKLEHSNQQEIFRCLSSKMKSMRKYLSGESLPMAMAIDCGDSQFHAALSMEARSRSPLPPSPTSSTQPHHDIDSVPCSQTANGSVKPLLTFTDLLPPPLLKPKPQKPPRKHLPQQKSDKELPEPHNKLDYEPIAPLETKPGLEYDKIEYRTDAWRTLGVDDIKHTEIEHTEQDLNSFPIGKSQESLNVNTIPLPKASKIITQLSNQSINSDDRYDKLQFFGSSSKLSNPKSGYKQVKPIPTVPSSMAAGLPSWNDYDEVTVSMEAVRRADDSYLGYGMIRKQTTAQPAEPISSPTVHHQLVNDTAYAIISKPKRV